MQIQRERLNGMERLSERRNALSIRMEMSALPLTSYHNLKCYWSDLDDSKRYTNTIFTQSNTNHANTKNELELLIDTLQ